ncbi:TPA: hypothetical protein DD799_03455 [Candidatus Dependentiae bacterium]|nr:hypothetical protein [Candidatus Dependentiae bacterium]
MAHQEKCRPLYDLIEKGLSASEEDLRNFAQMALEIQKNPDLYHQLFSVYENLKCSVKSGIKMGIVEERGFTQLVILETFIKVLTEDLFRKGMAFPTVQSESPSESHEDDKLVVKNQKNEGFPFFE